MREARRVLAGLAICATAWLLCAGDASATPTELFNIPTTDTQNPNKPHADLVYAALGTGAWDVGALAGLSDRTEIALDYIAPGHPTDFLGVKWRPLDETANAPAMAVGILTWSPASAFNSANEAYLVFGKHFGGVRLTAGAYHLNGRLFAQQTGVIAGIDGAFGKRWSASIDTTSGTSTVGISTVGIGYQLTPQININPGYVIQNNRTNGPNAFQIEIHADLK